MNVDLELLQFRHSNYNEKVRWALEFKGLRHTKTDLLPGPHTRTLKKLTGQTQTPVLRMNSQYIPDSTSIVERLELVFKDAPKLFPADEDLEDRAREVARHFDFVVGPAVRICVFTAMLDEPRYVADLFSAGKSPLTRALYRTVMPLLVGPIKRANGMTEADSYTRASRLLETNMESLATVTFKRRYLAGDAFSVADLTAASMIAPLIDPPHPDMQLPRPMPPKLAELTQKWRDHAAGRWALEMYELHRTRTERDASGSFGAVTRPS